MVSKEPVTAFATSDL